MKRSLILLLFIPLFQVFSQQNVPVDSLYKPDPYYLEDQFYFGISYVALKNLPEGFEQNGFSNSIKLGYIRDLPLNERRNFGLGIGIGLGWDNYYQNIRISTDEETGEIVFELLDDNADFISNSFSVNKLEFPFEIRWRGSTMTKYKFWRLYTGLVASYVLSTSSEFVTNNIDVSYKNIRIIKPWQFGFSLSLGYGSWNFNYYLGLSDIIKDNISVEDKTFQMKDMRFGIILYFL
jgi:hypothetical protein